MKPQTDRQGVADGRWLSLIFFGSPCHFLRKNSNEPKIVVGMRIIYPLLLLPLLASGCLAAVVCVGNEAACAKFDAGEPAQPWITPNLGDPNQDIPPEAGILNFTTVYANVGDTLAFAYLTGFHTVNLMDSKAAYDDCDVSLSEQRSHTRAKAQEETFMSEMNPSIMCHNLT